MLPRIAFALAIVAVAALLPASAQEKKKIEINPMILNCSDASGAAIRRYHSACKDRSSPDCASAREALRKLCNTCKDACIL